TDKGGRMSVFSRDHFAKRSSRHRRWPLALLILATVGLSQPAVAGAATNTSNAKKAVKPDFAFYRGQTIRMETPQAPGTALMNVYVAMIPYLENYLHATINIVSLNPNTTLADEDIEAAQAPTGLNVALASYASITGQEIFSTPSNPQQPNFSLLKGV